MIRILSIPLVVFLINSLTFVDCRSIFKQEKTNENLRPIIGILSQPTGGAWSKPNGTTYIAASYVKFVEATGAQVVPIQMYQPIDYYTKLYNSLNGVLFPGGDLSDEYLYVANLFYTWSIQDFDKNQKVFPIWATCLGFEVMFMLTKRSTNVLDACQGYDFATNLNFMPDASQSRLFGPSLPNSIRDSMTKKATTSNFHNFCVHPENFTADPVISSFYRMLSTSVDLSGRPFVSTIESKRYPFFGVQWHPEKNGFEWHVNSTIPHDESSISVMQYVANFFTNQTRENFNRFSSLDDETKYSIYQYTPEFFGLGQSHFQQIYFFYQ